MFHLLFDFGGRIDRSRFLIGITATIAFNLLVLIALAVATYLSHSDVIIGVGWFAVLASTFWNITVVMVKRLRDMGLHPSHVVWILAGFSVLVRMTAASEPAIGLSGVFAGALLFLWLATTPSEGESAVHAPEPQS